MDLKGAVGREGGLHVSTRVKGKRMEHAAVLGTCPIWR